MEITLEVFLLIETRNVKSVHVAGMTFFLTKIKQDFMKHSHSNVFLYFGKHLELLNLHTTLNKKTRL